MLMVPDRMNSLFDFLALPQLKSATQSDKGLHQELARKPVGVAKIANS